MSSLRECCSCFNLEATDGPDWRSDGDGENLSWYCPVCWNKRHPESARSPSDSKPAESRNRLSAVDNIPARKLPFWAKLLFSNSYRSVIAFSVFFLAAVLLGFNTDRITLGLLAGLVTGTYAVVFSFLGVFGLKSAASNPSSSMAGWWLWLTFVMTWGIIGCGLDLCYAMLSPHTNESVLDVAVGLLALPPASGISGGIFMLGIVIFGSLGWSRN